MRDAEPCARAPDRARLARRGFGRKPWSTVTASRLWRDASAQRASAPRAAAARWNRARRKPPERGGGECAGAKQTVPSPRRRRDGSPQPQQRTRFCSRSTPCFTPAEARGNLRKTSPSDAQAASFSPARRATGRGAEAHPAPWRCSYLVETLRKASAASRKRCRWNSFRRASRSHRRSADRRDICSGSRGRLSSRAHNPCAARSHKRGRIRRAASAKVRACAGRRRRRRHCVARTGSPVAAAGAVERSSGAPASRPPGAPTGGRLHALERGGGGGVHRAERVRRARRNRDCGGSKASPRLPGSGAADWRWPAVLRGETGSADQLARRGASSCMRRTLALELLVAVLQLLDRAGELADLCFRAAPGEHGDRAGGLRRAIPVRRARCGRRPAVRYR